MGTAALIGSLLVVLSDITSRLILAPQDLPIGIVTAAFGALFVIFLVMRKSEVRLVEIKIILSQLKQR